MKLIFENMFQQGETVAVTDCLRANFGNNILALNGLIPWSARSSDLFPFDFYLWGQAKNEIYEFELPENVDFLRERVIGKLFCNDEQK